MKAKRIRVKLRRFRRVVGELWAQSVDPADRFVARTIFRSDLDPALQMRLLRSWLALR